MRTLIVSGFLAKDSQIDTLPTTGSKVLNKNFKKNENINCKWIFSKR
nr:MAG TPA: hypothetical protein [Bacteriophage sp.]